MYAAPAWQGIQGAVCIDWPEYRNEVSIAQIADRIIETAHIPDGTTLIGSSLGGIVACEIAKKRKVKALILIGSATHPREVSELLARLHPLARLAPFEFLQTAAAKIPNELTRMFSRSQASFIRATCFAIFDWPGLGELGAKPIRIHGKRDHVIPIPQMVDLALNGGHLLAMTHAKECVEFLKLRGLV